MQYLYLICGLVIGLFVAFFYKRKDARRIIELTVQKGSFEEQKFALNERIKELEVKLDQYVERITALEKEKASLQTELIEGRKGIEEQKRLLEKAQSELKTVFQALSGEALKSNNSAFVELAKQVLNSILQEAKGDIGKKEEAIKGLIKPLEESLKKYEEQINAIERKRNLAYGSLETQIKAMMDAQQQLQKETGNLVTALRKPEVKGSWGQITLQKVVELAGMTEYCDFETQVSVNTAEGQMRPDMIVRLPSEREIIIDSKVSTNAYLEAIESTKEEGRKSLMLKHARQIRDHMRRLAAKSYWEQFEKSPEFVVMFLPGESFFSMALAHDPLLIEDGMKNRVVLATPTTLMALLKAIAYGWRQEQITQNAREVSHLGKELYDRFQPFLEHLGRTGGALKHAVEHYNKMVSSLDQRVLVSVRRFRELGVTSGKELEEPELIDHIPVSGNR